MNKLLKYGMTGLLGLALASPALAATGGNGQWNSDNGSHWYNQRAGDNNWNSNGDNGQRYGQNGNYGENGGQRYGQNGYNGGQDQGYGNNGGQQAVTRGFVAQLQRRLQQEGFYHQGNVDGVWGPETQSALSNFQQQNNLRPSGQIDMRTLRALMNGGNGGQYGMNNGSYGQNQSYGENQSYGQNNGSYGQNGESYGQNGESYGQNRQQYSQNGNEGYNAGSNGNNTGAYGNNNRAPNYYGSSGATNMGNSGTGGGSGNR